MMRSFLALALVIASGVRGAPLGDDQLPYCDNAPSLHACQSQISNPLHDLVREVKVGNYIQCEYSFSNPDGSSSGEYCFYHLDYSLTHFPDTPLRVDSSPDCPQTMPLASTYIIKPDNAPGKCVTVKENRDGAPVTLEDCDYRHGNPGQKWAFKDYQIRIFDNKCLDVTDGSLTNGVKLQIWTCFDGNTNQEYFHSGDDVLSIPKDTISWATHPEKCMDLTDGKLDNGNRIQMWDCYPNNHNQVWTISVTR